MRHAPYSRAHSAGRAVRPSCCPLGSRPTSGKRGARSRTSGRRNQTSNVCVCTVSPLGHSVRVAGHGSRVYRGTVYVRPVVVTPEAVHSQQSAAVCTTAPLRFGRYSPLIRGRPGETRLRRPDDGRRGLAYACRSMPPGFRAERRCQTSAKSAAIKARTRRWRQKALAPGTRRATAVRRGRASRGHDAVPARARRTVTA
jgi:hypothetical protein